jgi:hypothetical protein
MTLDDNMKTILTSLILINLLVCEFIYMTPNNMYSVGEDQLDHIFDNLRDSQGVVIDESRLDQMSGLENKYGLTGKKALHYTLLQTGGMRYALGHRFGLILILANTAFLGALRFRKDKNIQQSVAEYSPRGVGSRDVR